MIRCLSLLCVLLLAPLFSDQKKNILLICVDDLRPELKCFGVNYIHSPNIDALAAKGRIFTRHYVQSPTCGASRYALLTGHYGPDDNHALFKRAEAIQAAKPIPASLPAYFKEHGYATYSMGKVSHHPGGMGGEDWNDPSILEMPNSWGHAENINDLWRHPRGWMHGLAHGETREEIGKMNVMQSISGADTIYPDGPLTEKTLEKIDQLANSTKPFFLALGFVRPHLPFGAPKKYMKYYQDVELPVIPHKNIPDWYSGYHQSGEFTNYNRWGQHPNQNESFALELRKHYAACVSYIDAQVGKR